MATHFAMSFARKVVVLDLCGYLKILKILPGLIHAFDSVRCQTLSWLLLRILWTPRPHGRHLRRKPTSMPHWGRPMPGLSHEVIELKANPFLKSLQEEGVFVHFSSLPAQKNAAARCALPMKAACGALLRDLAFQGPVRVCKPQHLFLPYSSLAFHRWHGGIV